MAPGSRASGIAIAMLLAVPAHADDPPPGESVDKSAYSVFDPTPDSQLRPFSSDRPGKAESPISLDAGRFQVESEVVSWVYDRTGTTSLSALEVAAPVLKLGLTDSVDAEIGLSLYQHVRGRSAGTTSTAEGFGDMTLAAKINLFGNDGGDSAMALIPSIVLPTSAPGLGNSTVSYSLAAPFNQALPGDWTFALQPTLAVAENAANTGSHTEISGSVGFSHSVLAETVTGSLELFGLVSSERGARAYATFDPSLAWLVGPNLQLDAGVYIGLNAAAPDWNPYVGISYRY
ncbi:MAG TPA: transporter [Stellaceae bacterium]|nr:transporter [Stellaceae bacterium]